MWRSFFLAFGLTMCVVGLECLVVDDFILTTRYSSSGGFIGAGDGSGMAARDLNPPDWVPWSLLSAGAVTMLYSFTIPQRVKK